MFVASEASLFGGWCAAFVSGAGRPSPVLNRGPKACSRIASLVGFDLPSDGLLLHPRHGADWAALVPGGAGCLSGVHRCSLKAQDGS